MEQVIGMTASAMGKKLRWAFFEREIERNRVKYDVSGS